MRGVLRIALAWLLVLALPVQGVAAQAMLFCGPMHAPSATQAQGVLPLEHDPAPHDHASHGHGRAQGHGHGAAQGREAVMPQTALVPAAHPSATSSPEAPQEAHAHTGAAQQAGSHDAAAQPSSLGQADPTASAAKCSVCASFCSMAFIGHAIVAFETLPLPRVYALAPFEPHASRTAGGLDRPPKHAFA